MCKNVPSIEQRNYEWIHNHAANKGDELELIVNTRLMPEWESRGFITRDVEAFRYKMNQGLPKNREEEITDDDLLLDGITEEFPGEECVIKGLRRPNDNTLRHLRDRRAKNRHMREMKTVGGYDSICRGKNGKTHFDNSDEWEAAIVATKEKHEPYDPGYWRRVDRRKSRRNGKAECGRYTPEMFGDDFEDEELREIFPEKADGTIDLDAYLAEEEYSEWDDWNDSYWELEDEEDLVDEEISRLTREINIYKDFIGEFNLNRLYEVWLAQNGKGAM